MSLPGLFPIPSEGMLFAPNVRVLKGPRPGYPRLIPNPELASSAPVAWSSSTSLPPHLQVPTVAVLIAAAIKNPRTDRSVASEDGGFPGSRRRAGFPRKFVPRVCMTVYGRMCVCFHLAPMVCVPLCVRLRSEGRG